MFLITHHLNYQLKRQPIPQPSTANSTSNMSVLIVDWTKSVLLANGSGEIRVHTDATPCSLCSVGRNNVQVMPAIIFPVGGVYVQLEFGGVTFLTFIVSLRSALSQFSPTTFTVKNIQINHKTAPVSFTATKPVEVIVHTITKHTCVQA